MHALTPFNAIFCLFILVICGFVLLAPAGTVAKTMTTVGNAFQQFLAWVKSLFVKK